MHSSCASPSREPEYLPTTSFNHGLKAAPKGVIILLYFLPAKWVAEVSLRSQRRPSGCTWNLDQRALKGSGIFTIPKILVAQSCLTLCSPMDCSTPGSSVDFPGKNTGVGCYVLLQRIFLTQGSNLLHCRQILYHLSH